jgi:hypothetical protein
MQPSWTQVTSAARLAGYWPGDYVAQPNAGALRAARRQQPSRREEEDGAGCRGGRSRRPGAPRR